ncbi:TolC family protein, partial [Ideonella sp.]|uniref:TolC family protein n=1 Tax=Ideonella sp. TaxID=1929293 RepID=UPI003BB5CF35
RQQLADAGEALAQLTGQRPAALKPLATDLPALLPQPADVEAWVDQALSANPQLQAQRLSVEASGQRVSAAASAHLPTLSAGLDSARRSGSGLATTGEAPRAHTLSLTLTVPLFAGGATESLRRQALLQRDQAGQALEATRRELLRETRAQYQAVQSGVATLASSQMAVSAARKALESTRAGQALGTRTMTDLLLAIQNLATAQTALDQARHRYVLAKLLLLQAAGSLGPAEMAAANQLLGDS